VNKTVYYYMWCSALVVLAVVVWSWVVSRTPYAVIHGLVLLMMDDDARNMLR